MFILCTQTKTIYGVVNNTTHSPPATQKYTFLFQIYTFFGKEEFFCAFFVVFSHLTAALTKNALILSALKLQASDDSTVAVGYLNDKR